MSKDIAVRLVSPAGRSRITLPATATFADLQTEVKSRTGVEPGEQRFALDPGGRQPVSGAPSASLSSVGIANGTQLHLVNKEASLAPQILTRVPVAVEPEAPVAKEAGSGGGAAGSSSSSGAGGGASSSSSSAPTGTQAIAGDATKKPDPKFETFDAFLRKRQYDVGALPGSQKYVTATIKRGGMIKIPPSVSIKTQPYRHVDTLSVINVPEMENFIGYWMGSCLENGLQRAGFMYGYYLEDKNYDEGTRAIMEGIYEPPQEMVGELSLPIENDPDHARVDRIAEALGLERIGWISTSLPLEDGVLLSPAEVQYIAKLQNAHSTDAHFTKYRLSKFVSCAVRPDPALNGAPGINPFMVSEQACAMERDGIMTSSPAEPKYCLVREPAKDEMIPDFVVEGGSNNKIATDFFVVRVNDTAPKKHSKLLTQATFPRENRPTHPQRRDADLKRYFSQVSKSGPSWSQFADFHLLLFIAKEIDVDTAIAIAHCVRDRQEIPEGVKMLFNQYLQ